MPMPVRKRQTKKYQGANANAVATVAPMYSTERDHEELLAAVAVGELAEEQRAETGAGDVERGGDPDVRARQVEIPLPASVRRGAIAPTIVTSSPSRTQTVPRPITMRQWNRDHGSRSRRPGSGS